MSPKPKVCRIVIDLRSTSGFFLVMFVALATFGLGFIVGALA